jgi:hypothetical protein
VWWEEGTGGGGRRQKGDRGSGISCTWIEAVKGVKERDLAEDRRCVGTMRWDDASGC